MSGEPQYPEFPFQPNLSPTESSSSSGMDRRGNSTKPTDDLQTRLASSRDARTAMLRHRHGLSETGGRSGDSRYPPIHIHLHEDAGDEGSPTGDSEGELFALVCSMKEILMSVQDTIDQLKAKVEANTSATNSIVASYQALAQAIRDSKDDPEELEALAASIEANTNSLTNAVTSNTVVADDEDELPEDEPVLGGDTFGGDAGFDPSAGGTVPVSTDPSVPIGEAGTSSVEVVTETTPAGQGVPTEESENQPEVPPGATA